MDTKYSNKSEKGLKCNKSSNSEVTPYFICWPYYYLSIVHSKHVPQYLLLHSVHLSNFLSMNTFFCCFQIKCWTSSLSLSRHLAQYFIIYDFHSAKQTTIMTKLMSFSLLLQKLVRNLSEVVSLNFRHNQYNSLFFTLETLQQCVKDQFFCRMFWS